jgi:hypothetical protein
MGYAIRITTRAVEVVSGADSTPGIVAAEASGVKVGLRAKWGGGELRSRPQSGRMVRQGNGWVLEGSPAWSTNGGGSYSNSPVAGAFPSPAVPSPYMPSPGASAPPAAGTRTPSPSLGAGAVGLGLPSGTFGPAPGTPGTPGAPGMNGHGHVHTHGRGHGHMRTPSLLGGQPRTTSAHTPSLQANGAEGITGIPSYTVFPPTPPPGNGGVFESQQGVVGQGQVPVKDGKKDD